MEVLIIIGKVLVICACVFIGLLGYATALFCTCEALTEKTKTQRGNRTFVPTANRRTLRDFEAKGITVNKTDV